MRHTVLIVPGVYGSGPDHWQTWIQAQLSQARRVGGIDWDAPVLARWAARVRREIDESPHAVWLVAHSFGCLASVVAAADRPEKVAGVLLVAPADPERFSPAGLRGRATGAAAASIAPCLPQRPLGVASVMVASSNDPWLNPPVAQDWAERWGSRLIDLGPAGHINAESGYGPWPFGLELLRAMQKTHNNAPLGAIGEGGGSPRGRRGVLARLRHRTRAELGFLPKVRPRACQVTSLQESPRAGELLRPRGARAIAQ